MKKILFLCALFCAIACRKTETEAERQRSGKIPIDKQATPETLALYKRLFALADSGTMIGHQDATAYGHDWNNEPERSDMHDVTGFYPAVVGFELGHLELGADHNLNHVFFDNMKQYVKEHHARGGILTFSWHADNIATGGSAWDCEPATVLSVLQGGLNHKRFLTWLDRLSEFFLDLKDNEGQLIPVMFRPWHEHSGSWFWWGSGQCNPNEYKQLWRITVEYLRDTKNVHNLLYVYSPYETNNENHYLERYPGDDYVDILGFDSYVNSENEMQNEERIRQQIERYKNAMINNLNIVTRYAKSVEKPVAITETGMERFLYPHYFSEALYKSLQSFNISYVLFWRNAWKNETHYYIPFAGHPAAQDFIDFVNKPKMLKIKQ